MNKPFAWSWSKLKNYRTCPKRHWHVDIQKDFHEEESGQLKWGHEVHEALAKRIDKGIPLPLPMEHYDKWAQPIMQIKSTVAKVKVEQKLAMSKDFKPVGFFDNAAWFRGVVDASIEFPKHATVITFDWKTGGKVQPEFEQLALSAQLVFSHYPKVKQVGALYIWLGHDLHTVKAYTPDTMVPVWNDLWPTINQMAEAHRTVTYPPKPSGLCVRYCPVTSCPYHGKGNR